MRQRGTKYLDHKFIFHKYLDHKFIFWKKIQYIIYFVIVSIDMNQVKLQREITQQNCFEPKIIWNIHLACFNKNINRNLSQRTF